MKFVHYINSPLLWKDSTNTAFAILAGIETLFAVSAISLEKFWGDYSWIIKLLFVIVIFLIIDVVIFIIKHSLAKDGISLNIRGIKVIFLRQMAGKLLLLMNILTHRSMI